MISMTTCKACNSTSNGMICIYNHPNNLDSMYTYVSGIQEILPDDTMCIPCYDDLKISYSFKRKCIQTNLLHKNVINNTKSTVISQSPSIESTISIEQTLDPANQEQLADDINLTTLENVISFNASGSVVECDEVIRNEHNEHEIFEFFVEHQKNIDANTTNQDFEVQKQQEQQQELATKTSDMNEKTCEREAPFQSSVFVCNDCGKNFSRSGNLRRHQKSIHFIEKVSTKKGRNKFKRGPSPKLTENDIFATLRESQCEFCFRDCGTLDERNVHENEHRTEEKPYKCFHSNCNSQFKERFNFRKHMETHSNVKKYKCNYCDKYFHQKGNMISHERHHTGERPYICDHCGKLFAESGNLKAHVRFHSGERPYSCSYCPKRFTTHYSHKIHVRSHTKERPYLCSDCGKRFISSGKLLVHKRIHLGLKPYKCDVCTAAFVDSSGLKRHSKIHSSI